MPSLKRVKTKYLGVYYVMGRSKVKYGKPERIYYIRYRKNGKEIEEKVGRQFQDEITPSEAAKIRAECIEGRRLPRNETRYREKANSQTHMDQDIWAGIRKDAAPEELKSFELKPDLENNRPSHGALKKQIQGPVRTVADLWGNEQLYRILFESSKDAISLIDTEGNVIETNEAQERILGWTREEVLGKNVFKGRLFSPKNAKANYETLKRALAGQSLPVIAEREAFRKDGTQIFIEISSNVVKKDGRPVGFLVSVRDITNRKHMEHELQQHRDHLEELVNERTVNLEQANTALKVLLKKRDEDKIELEDKMVLNVKELVLPFLEELKNRRLNDEQKGLAEVIEYNLNDIISPFVKVLSSKYYNLTPTEIQIANLIKQGKSSKEIAEQFKMSPRTVDIHRYHIRKKLGISSKKANLRTHLLSIN